MKDEIRNYLIANAPTGRSRSFPTTNRCSRRGVIDSATMIDLIAHLEGGYGIAVDEDEMMPENFETIDAIAEYVAGKQVAAQA